MTAESVSSGNAISTSANRLLLAGTTASTENVHWSAG